MFCAGVELMARTGKNPQCAKTYSNQGSFPFLVQHSFPCGSTDASLVTETTTKSPWTDHRYSYLQLGCSKAQEQVMLRYAKKQVGKPFSQMAMARSLIFPRQTSEKNW